MMRSYSNFYKNGGFHPCTGTNALQLVNPANELPVARVQTCSSQEVEEAVMAAHAAFETWSRSSIAERQLVLRQLRDELASRAESLYPALATEMGCPVWLGELMQMPMALKGLELAIEGLTQIDWEEQIGNGLVERVPSGVVLAITPWNFPLHQIVAKVDAAIAAGCTVVLKPSEIAAGAAQIFMEAIHATDLPPGVVNLVWGGADIGEQLVRHPLVDRISFTGSTQVGRRIMAAAAEGLKPLTLELGGKSAAVLMEDADLEVAVPTVVRLALANSGQACVAQSRLIAPRHLMPEITERARAAMAQWPVGDPHDARTRLGPVATQVQFNRILSMIERARQQGALLIEGGSTRQDTLDSGFFVQPTLLGEVKAPMEIAQEEVFGPVLSLMAYDNEAEAAAMANSTRYGLSGAVWSRDAGRARDLARLLKTGQVVINGASQNLATPFGGLGWSGFGRENGRFGIEDLLNYRALHDQ